MHFAEGPCNAGPSIGQTKSQKLCSGNPRVAGACFSRRVPHFSRAFCARSGRNHHTVSLLADAEFPNDSLIALGIVSLEVVEQATPLADQHKQAAARAVVLLVHLEVVRQLANAFTDNGDLNLGTPRVSRVRLILVNDRFLLLSG